jgi:hypothetical protein
MTETKLAYTTKTITTHTLQWTETVRATEWTCGPLTVKLRGLGWRQAWGWVLILDDATICRGLGYTTARDAMRAAKDHKAVQELIAKQEDTP